MKRLLGQILIKIWYELLRLFLVCSLMAMYYAFLFFLSVCAALASGSIDIANTEDDLTVQDMKVVLRKQSEQLQRLERRLAVLENKEQNDRCCESTAEIVEGTGRGRKSKWCVFRY